MTIVSVSGSTEVVTARYTLGRKIRVMSMATHDNESTNVRYSFAVMVARMA